MEGRRRKNRVREGAISGVWKCHYIVLFLLLILRLLLFPPPPFLP
jgi:hypothetical protein